MTLLEIKRISKSFGGVKAVNNCSFEVEEGNIVGLIGPNGAGKTTLFNIISGFYRPDDGEIILEGEPITNEKIYRIANLGMARTFQLLRVFPKLTALENVMLAKNKKGENFLVALFKPRYVKEELKDNRKRAIEFLKLVGLENKANELAGNLSYGQQKLLGIAKALAQEPKIILLDEPTAGVNPVMKEKIRRLLIELNKEGKTILVIEHDMKFIMNLCKKIVVMDYGKEIATGTPKEIQNNKKVLDAYLGK